jgi:hypothetical protein
MYRVKDAYLAGILDGEGSFGIHPTGRAFVRALEVSCTTPKLIDWLYENYPGGILVVKHPKNQSWATNYAIRWHGDKAALVAEKALPYLLLKKRHAEIFLSWPKSGRGVKPTEEQIQLKSDLIAEIRSINYKGRRYADGSSEEKAPRECSSADARST